MLVAETMPQRAFTDLSGDMHRRGGEDRGVPDLRFGVLGPLEVWRDGSRLVVPGGRRASVLAALLVHAGRAVEVDVLLEAAWGAELPEEPRSALYTVISRLRSLLGDGSIGAEPAGYRIEVGVAGLDSLRFEELSRRAGAVGPEQAARLLDEALSLWRGKAYAEFADRGFAEVESQRLELLRLDAREERARTALDLDDPADAVRRLEGLVAEEPYREQVVSLLMTALQRCGRTAAALDRYQEHRRRLADELGLDPAPAVQELHARLLAGGAPRRIPPGPGMPDWVDTSTTFVGRRLELETLVSACVVSRVVSVTGPGGVGKTRLVAEATPELRGRLALPAAVVELAAVGPGEVTGAVSAAVTGGSGPVDRAELVARLRADPTILVLDNCEHVVRETAQLVELVARRCPDIRVVLTSRHRLGLPSEHVLPLVPLPGPSTGTPSTSGGRSPAEVLLVDRIRRARPGFQVTDHNAPAVREICRRLDGLPLALELAASRVHQLGLEGVRAALADDPGVLDKAGWTGQPMRALVDWSCALLSDDERDLFAALSVFPGEFGLAAVSRLVAGMRTEGTGRDTHTQLAELIDSSLVSARELHDGLSCRLLTVVRVEAGRRLAESGRAEQAGRAHARWVAELTGAAADDCTGPNATAAMLRLLRGRADIAAALRWALGHGEAGLAAAIAGAVQRCPHWLPQPGLDDLIIEAGERSLRDSGAHAAEAIGAAGVVLASRGDLGRSTELGRAALRAATSPAELYLAHLALGLATLYGGEYEESVRHWRAIAELAELPVALRAEGHTSMALLARFAGDLDLALEHAGVAVLSADASGSAPVQAFAAYAAGEAAVAQPDQGIASLRRAAEQATSTGCVQIAVLARIALLAALVRTGDDGAARVGVPLLADVRRMAMWPQLCTIGRIVAELAAATDRPQEAALLLAAATAQPGSPPAQGVDEARYARLRQQLEQRLGRHLLDMIWTMAAGLSRDQLAARAGDVLATKACSRRPGEDRGGVSTRRTKCC